VFGGGEQLFALMSLFCFWTNNGSRM